MSKEEDEERKKFVERNVKELIWIYNIVKDFVPRGTPDAVVAAMLENIKAALYYYDKDAAKKSAVVTIPPAINDTVVENMLNALDWKNGKNDSQWTFRTNQDGTLVEALKPLEPTLEKIKMAKYMKIGKWKYSISGEDDKFLSRYPA
ncbi:MAG: hypothetical protein QW658_01195 [Candidatus Bathyarchaeia archaeon]